MKLSLQGSTVVTVLFFTTAMSLLISYLWSISLDSQTIALERSRSQKQALSVQGLLRYAIAYSKDNFMQLLHHKEITELDLSSVCRLLMTDEGLKSSARIKAHDRGLEIEVCLQEKEKKLQLVCCNLIQRKLEDELVFSLENWQSIAAKA